MDERIAFSKNHNIAFVCFSSSLGGLELSMLKLASEFNKRAANCLIIVPPGTPLAQSARKYDLNVELLKTKWKYCDVSASIRLAQILRIHHTDVAVLMQSKDMSIVTIAHLLYPSVKLVFYQEMQFSIDKRDFFHTLMYSHLSQWITLTKRMKQEVIKHTEMPLERISVIPIGTEIQRFDPFHYNQNTTRQQFGIPQSETVIGVLGRLDPQKGQDDFIRAIPILLKHQTNLHFVIAGDETKSQHGYKKKLENLSIELGVNDYVQFIPFTNAVPEFMSAIDFFILPSHAETFGFVLIEAMAMGKMIIATDAGGVPEIITDGVTGLLVPPRDEQELADAILKLLNDRDLQSSLSLKARTDALKRFNITRCIDQLVASLDNL